MVPDKLQNTHEQINDIGLFECAVVCCKHIRTGDMSSLNDPNCTQDNQMNTKM